MDPKNILQSIENWDTELLKVVISETSRYPENQLRILGTSKESRSSPQVIAEHITNDTITDSDTETNFKPPRKRRSKIVNISKPKTPVQSLNKHAPLSADEEDDNMITDQQNNTKTFNFPPLPPKTHIVSNQLASTQASNSQAYSKTPSPSHKTSRIPPLTIKNKACWDTLRQVIKDKNIKIKQIINKKDGLEVFPSESKDHRILTKILDEHNQEYFTFNLPEDKFLRVVIRSVPVVIKNDDDGNEYDILNEIKQELTDKGFTIISLISNEQKTSRWEQNKNSYPSSPAS